MRIKIELQGPPNLFIPFNYNHILASIIYTKIKDINLAAKLHLSTNFKFFTFSQIMIPNRKRVKSGFTSIDGLIYFFISSPNDELINNLILGFMKDKLINFMGQTVKINNVELLNKPRIKDKMHFTTLSPIITTIKKEMKGKFKIWDVGPGEAQFYTGLQKNIIKKYIEFYGKYKGDKKVFIDPDIKKSKRKRIAIKKGDITTYHRAYLLNFDMYADKKLINFAYDCGLGSKNSMGFGMVKAL